MIVLHRQSNQAAAWRHPNELAANPDRHGLSADLAPLGRWRL